LIDTVSNENGRCFVQHTNWDLKKGKPYANCLFEKLEKNESDQMHKGITATAGGFTVHKDVFVFEYSR
jgi:uridine phosphorylase